MKTLHRCNLELLEFLYKIHCCFGCTRTQKAVREAAWPIGLGRWIWNLEIPGSNPPPYCYLDLFSVVPSSTPRPRCVNSQLVSVSPVGILNSFCFYLQYLFKLFRVPPIIIIIIVVIIIIIIITLKKLVSGANRNWINNETSLNEFTLMRFRLRHWGKYINIQRPSAFGKYLKVHDDVACDAHVRNLGTCKISVVVYRKKIHLTSIALSKLLWVEELGTWFSTVIGKRWMLCSSRGIGE